MSVNNKFCGILVSPLESPIMFGDNVKITSVSFFIANFSLFNCKFNSFTFKLLY